MVIEQAFVVSPLVSHAEHRREEAHMTAITIQFPARSTLVRPVSRRLPASVYWKRRAVVVLLALGAGWSGQVALDVLDVLGDGPLTVAEAPSTGSLPVVELDTTPVVRRAHV